MSLAGRGEWPQTGYSALRAADVTTERREELRDAARQIAAGEGVGLEDVAVADDRPVSDRCAADNDLAWLAVTSARGHRWPGDMNSPAPARVQGSLQGLANALLTTAADTWG